MTGIDIIDDISHDKLFFLAAGNLIKYYNSCLNNKKESLYKRYEVLYINYFMEKIIINYQKHIEIKLLVVVITILKKFLHRI